MRVLLFIFGLIGLLFKWFFFAVGVTITGIVLNELLKDAAARRENEKTKQIY